MNKTIIFQRQTQPISVTFDTTDEKLIKFKITFSQSFPGQKYSQPENRSS